MIIHVETLEDKRLETYVGLTEIQLRNRLEPEKGIFIAESEKVIVRALDAGYEPLSLLIPEHRLQRSARLVERIETQYALEEKAGAGGSTNDESIPIFVAPSDEIEKLTGFELTRGVLCAMKRKPLPSLADLLADAYRVAVLEDITNHTNVGAVFRNAAALGFDALIVSPGCCDPPRDPRFYGNSLSSSVDTLSRHGGRLARIGCSGAETRRLHHCGACVT